MSRRVCNDIKANQIKSKHVFLFVFFFKQEFDKTWIDKSVPRKPVSPVAVGQNEILLT